MDGSMVAGQTKVDITVKLVSIIFIGYNGGKPVVATGEFKDMEGIAQQMTAMAKGLA